MSSHVAGPRPECPGCGRALVAWVAQVAVRGACYCDRITVLPTRTRILLLQHPREERVAIGTARMAMLALPNARRRVGLDFSQDPEVLAALASSSPAYVLFPGPGDELFAEIGRASCRKECALLCRSRWSPYH